MPNNPKTARTWKQHEEMMVCILLNSDDAPGKWLAHSLQQVSAKPIKVISAEELVYAPEFTCGFRNGQAFFSIKLHSGFCFRSDTSTTIINRINFLKLQHLPSFKQEDQGYVQSELHAIFTFLFAALPNSLFNHASGRGLCGANRSVTEWKIMARQAGFQIGETLYQDKIISLPQPVPPIYPVVVFRNTCYSKYELSQKAEACCLALLALSEEQIIEVYLTQEDEAPFFAGATVQPSFAMVSDLFISDLNQLL